MFKNAPLVIVLFIILIAGTSSTFFYSWQPPTGSTGITPGVTCANNGTGCHSDHLVDTLGGGVTVNGLPTKYTPGVTYNFTLTITHSAANRTRWGFAMDATNGSGTPIGSFGDNNPFVSPSQIGTGDELATGDTLTFAAAPVTAASSTYTFTNLSWKAPATPQGAVTFHYAALAGNHDAASTGDFIYTGIKTIVVPITLNTFDASAKNNEVALNWQTEQEVNSNFFQIEKSTDGRQFTGIGRVAASVNSSMEKNYQFTDKNPTCYEKTNYYRLCMVDKDGEKKYSEVKNVVLKTSSTFVKNIYPNPLRSGETLHLNLVSNTREELSCRVISTDGKVIKTIIASVQKGTNILDVKLPVVTAGSYTLLVKYSGGQLKEPLQVY